MMDKWFVIINPVSGGKRAPKLWNKILPLLEKEGVLFDVAFTEYIYHASALATAALKNGYSKFLIIGGDGTANDVINGIYDSGIDVATITVAMIPAGTGNDWVRTIGYAKTINLIPKRLLQCETFLHDIGLVNCMQNGNSVKRYFINIAGLGFEGQVAKNLFESNGWLKGTKLQYQIAILKSLFKYQHTQLNITVDDVAVKQTGLSIAAGICQFNGGGLKQLPNAIYDDGLLDLTVIGSMSKLQMVINLPKLQSGSHIKLSTVSTYRGKKITIDSEPQIFIDVDGEYIGNTPVTIGIIPKAINVLKF